MFPTVRNAFLIFLSTLSSLALADISGDLKSGLLGLRGIGHSLNIPEMARISETMLLEGYEMKARSFLGVPVVTGKNCRSKCLLRITARRDLSLLVEMSEEHFDCPGYESAMEAVVLDNGPDTHSITGGGMRQDMSGLTTSFVTWRTTSTTIPKAVLSQMVQVHVAQDRKSFRLSISNISMQRRKVNPVLGDISQFADRLMGVRERVFACEFKH